MYRLNREAKELKSLRKISYSELGLKERYDIQEWVEKNPEILSEDILIIAKEFSGFDKTNERLDLAGLDKQGNVVIIELKRDDSGSDVTWQAIKYASYFSTLTTDEIFRIYSSYAKISEEESQQIITEFIEEGAELNQNQRIILVSREFRPEVTASVMWLLNKGLLFKCVTIQPYLDNATKEVFVVPSVILPPPNTDDYLIRVAKKEQENTQIATEKAIRSNDEISTFCRNIKSELQKKTDITDVLNPLTSSQAANYWDGLRYFHIYSKNGVWKNHQCSFQINISPEGRHVEKGKILVRFRLDKSYAEEKGIQEAYDKALSSIVQQLGNDFDIRNNKFLDIEKVIDYVELDLNTQEKVVTELEKLIEVIAPVINSFSHQVV